jgi:hypothetical protein
MNKSDDWLHVGALLAVALGAADAFLYAAGVLHQPAFNHDADLFLIAGGLAGFGVKIVNGLASIARNSNYPATPGTAAPVDPMTPAGPPPSAGSGGH